MCDIGGIFNPIGDFFSDVGRSIGSAAGRAFTPAGTGGAEARAIMSEASNRASAAALNSALNAQNRIAEESLTFARETQKTAIARSDAAIDEQKKANALAADASIPAVDREASRAASDARLRRLMAANPFGVRRGLKKLGDAPTGYRTVSGT